MQTLVGTSTTVDDISEICDFLNTNRSNNESNTVSQSGLPLDLPSLNSVIDVDTRPNHESINNKSESQSEKEPRHRWTELHLKKLRKYVSKYGTNKWSKIAKRMKKYQIWTSANDCEQKWIQIHSRTDSNRWQCDFCDKSYARPDGLKYHRYRHTNNWPFKCELCSKGFPLKSELVKHTHTHTKEKLFDCPECDYSTSNKAHLSRHLSVHSTDFPFQCNLCPKRFRHKASLQKHMRVHSDRKPHKCGFCEMAFRNSSNLKCHLRTHTNEKPYKCEFCGRLFTNRSNCVQHTRRHTGERPYHCPYDNCAARFVRNAELKSHVSRNHTFEKPHSCNDCEKRFIRKYELTLHIRRMHSKKT